MAGTPVPRALVRRHVQLASVALLMHRHSVHPVPAITLSPTWRGQNPSAHDAHVLAVGLRGSP